MKIIKNTLKIEEKIPDVPNIFRVGPKNVGPVGFPEMRHYFFRPHLHLSVTPSNNFPST